MIFNIHAISCLCNDNDEESHRRFVRWFFKWTSTYFWWFHVKNRLCLWLASQHKSIKSGLQKKKKFWEIWDMKWISWWEMNYTHHMPQTLAPGVPSNPGRPTSPYKQQNTECDLFNPSTQGAVICCIWRVSEVQIRLLSSHCHEFCIALRTHPYFHRLKNHNRVLWTCMYH